MDIWYKLLIGIGCFVAWSWLIFKISHFEKYLKHYTAIVQVLVSITLPAIGLWIDPYTTLIAIAFFAGGVLLLMLAYSIIGKNQ